MSDSNQNDIEVIDRKVVGGVEYVTLDVDGTQIDIRGEGVEIAQVDFNTLSNY